MTDEELLKKYVIKENQEQALKKLKEGYPIQYLIGNVDFYGLKLLVNENVLVPRFETEYLVEKTINYLKLKGIINPSILEIGTGSGCISIALKKNISCNVLAIDISNDAIEVAKENAFLNNTPIEFKTCDIHKFKSKSKYDLIISNPPYVKYDKNVEERIKYEPKNAIFASKNGLYYYDVILKQIKDNLKPTFLIAFEIDDKEGNEIRNIAYKYLGNVEVYIEKDYNNYERYVFITNK